MPLTEQLDRLAAFEPTTLPVISLYLNTEPNEHGRAQWQSFVRKAFSERLASFGKRSPERASFERDQERILAYLEGELAPPANSVAVFACAGEDDFWEAVQLPAPIPEHRLYVYHQPHLYPLARLNDQFPRYAALVVDTNAARLFVFGLAQQFSEERVQNTKVSRTSVGGWSQSRYQRHTENYHLHHAKEVVDVLERVVREEQIDRIVLAGDEVIIPLLREQMPQALAAKVVDVVRLDITTPEHEVLQATLEVVQEQDAQDAAHKVERLLDEYRADGLAVIGVHNTLQALVNGQVDEVLISTDLEQYRAGLENVGMPLAPLVPNTDANEMTRLIKVADQLVTKAHQTGATVTFIEDGMLLADVGGAGAFLRYRLNR